MTLAEKLPGWVFRGQREHCWRLESTLERFAATHDVSMPLVDAERRILDSFQHRVSDAVMDPPPSDDVMSWFGTIQHYGGPTRLLDFTYSLPVAAFFALEEEPESNRCAIWAINDIVVRGILAKQLMDAEGEGVACADAFAAGDLLNLTVGAEFSGPAAAAGLPRFSTERQRLQHGLYLFSLNLEYSLEQNLYGMFAVDPGDAYLKTLVGWLVNPLVDGVLQQLRRRPVIKIFVDKGIRTALLDELASAGVSRATLFPANEDRDKTVQDALAWSLNDLLGEQGSHRGRDDV